MIPGKWGSILGWPFRWFFADDTKGKLESSDSAKPGVLSRGSRELPWALLLAATLSSVVDGVRGTPDAKKFFLLKLIKYYRISKNPTSTIVTNEKTNLCSVKIMIFSVQPIIFDYS